MKKYITRFISIIFVICGVESALAFDFPSMPNLSAKSGSAVNPDEFLARAKSAEFLMRNSMKQMEAALVSKEKMAGFADREKAANSETNAAERDAKLALIEKDKDAALLEEINSADINKKIDQLDATKKQNLAGASFNFILALIQDKELSSQAAGMVSSLSSNPLMLTKLPLIKDAASSIGNQISSASTIAGKMPSIFSAVGVKAPTTKDEKPKEVKEVVGD